MTGWMHPVPAGWEDHLDTALAEDLGTGDLAAAALDPEEIVTGYIEFQALGVASGIGLAAACLELVADVEVLAEDGDDVEPGTKVLRFEGAAPGILSHERVALNFLMQMSGVATLTDHFVQLVDGTRAKIVDTRKTVPGMRALQKYAVRCGGGFNHRMGLYDAPMIKDNHIRAAGSIRDAIERLRDHIPHTAKIEVEADRPEQVDEAVQAGADIVLLDNMTPDMMRQIVSKHKSSRVLFEASGGVSLKTVRSIAETGVHLISVGALTHSAPSLSCHLELDGPKSVVKPRKR